MNGSETLRRLGTVDVLLDEKIAELKARLRGRLLTAQDVDYDAVRSIWNGMHDLKPGLIARCSGVADVVECVNFARSNGLLLSIRGGGHNVAGTASCDGGLMIDLSLQRSVRVDPHSRLVYVDPGATLGDVDRETQHFGLAVPLGMVSETGVAGLTLGGGIGYLRRCHGLACDALQSVEIVTAHGEFLHASEEQNADLFWAVRGGGGNFGVVTSFCFRAYPVGPEVFFLACLYPMEDTEEILRKVADFAEAMPDEVCVFCILQQIPPAEPFPREMWDRPVIAIAGTALASVEDGERLLQPLRELGTPVVDQSVALSFCDLQMAFDWIFPAGERYFWKMISLASMDARVIERLAELGRTRTSPRTVISIHPMGGAYARVGAADTAYGDRSAPWMVNMDSMWSDPEEDDKHIDWTRSAFQALKAFEGPGQYYQYGNIESREQIRHALGSTFDRLVAVKRKYDPENLFRVNQNIAP